MGDEVMPIYRNDRDYINHLEAQIAQFQRKFNDLSDELANERTQHRKLRHKYDDLASDYDKLKVDYNSTVKKNIGHDDIAERFRRLEEAVFAGKTDLIVGNTEPSASGSKDPPIQRQFFIQQPSKSSRNDKQPSLAPQQSSYPSSKSNDLRRPEDRTRERPEISNRPKSRQDDSNRSRRDEPSRSRRDEPNWSRSERDDPKKQKDERDNSRRRNRSRRDKSNRPDSRQKNATNQEPRHQSANDRTSRWSNSTNQTGTDPATKQQSTIDWAPRYQNSADQVPNHQNFVVYGPRQQAVTIQAPNHQSVTDRIPKQEISADWTARNQNSTDRTPKQRDQSPRRKQDSKKRDRQRAKPSIFPSPASNNINCGTYPGLTPMECPVKLEPQYLPWKQDSIPSLMSVPAPLPTTGNSENSTLLPPSDNAQKQVSPKVNNPKTPKRANSKTAVPTPNVLDPARLNARRIANKAPKVPDENRKPKQEPVEEISLIEQQQLARMIHVGPPLGMAAFVEDKDCEVNQSSKIKRRIAHQKSMSAEPPVKKVPTPSKIKPTPPKKDQPPSNCSSDEEEWEPSEIQFFRDFITRLNEAKDSASRQTVIDDMRSSGNLPRFLQFKRRYISENKS